MFIKAGTMIDATLVEADVKRPPMREGEASERDPAAASTRRDRRSFFGYDADRAVDGGSGPIRKAIVTSTYPSGEGRARVSGCLEQAS